MLGHAPDLLLFAERSAGMMILFSLLLAHESEGSFPPTRPVSISITGLARRFGVSRAHVLRLLRDAEHAGFLRRVGAGKDSIELQPKLTQAALDMFATMFLYLANCARTAMTEMAGERA